MKVEKISLIRNCFFVMTAFIFLADIVSTKFNFTYPVNISTAVIIASMFYVDWKIEKLKSELATKKGIEK